MSVRKAWCKRAGLFLLFILIGVFLVLCIWGAIQTNQNKISPQVETYSMGETVEIGKNFFADSVENPSGYTIQVNSVELANYEEFLISVGGDPADSYFTNGFPQYTYLVNVTIRNKENETGAIMALNYALCNQALKIPVDYYLWGLIDENFTGEPGFRLRTNSEMDITIPFTPDPLDTTANNEEIRRRMESEEFYFCVSEFPVRKQIQIIK